MGHLSLLRLIRLMWDELHDGGCRVVCCGVCRGAHCWIASFTFPQNVPLGRHIRHCLCVRVLLLPPGTEFRSRWWRCWWWWWRFSVLCHYPKHSWRAIATDWQSGSVWHTAACGEEAHIGLSECNPTYHSHQLSREYHTPLHWVASTCIVQWRQLVTLQSHRSGAPRTIHLYRLFAEKCHGATFVPHTLLSTSPNDGWHPSRNDRREHHCNIQHTAQQHTLPRAPLLANLRTPLLSPPIIQWCCCACAAILWGIWYTPIQIKFGRGWLDRLMLIGSSLCQLFGQKVSPHKAKMDNLFLVSSLFHHQAGMPLVSQLVSWIMHYHLAHLGN